MEDSKRVLIALVLSVVVLWVYTAFLAPQPAPKETATKAPSAAQAPAKSAATAPAPGTQAAPGATPALAPGAPSLPAGRTVMVETPLFKATFDERGGELRNLELLKYFNQPQEQGGYYNLVHLKDQPHGTLGVNLPPAAPQLSRTPLKADKDSLSVTQAGAKGSLTFTSQQGNLAIAKIFHFTADSYAVGLEVKVRNTGSTPVEITPELSLSDRTEQAQVNSYAFSGVQYLSSGKLEELDISDLEKKPLGSGNVSWMCLTVPYFMGSVIPLETGAGLKRSIRGSSEKGFMHGILVDTPWRLEPNQETSRQYLVFYGPRDLDILEPLGHDLSHAVDFGWFDIIAKPMLALLKFFYSFTLNYGIAVIIVTILTKILFWPLAQKSYKSMKQMQKLQPQVARLREKYKHDKQHMNQEMMQLYKTYKVNPMGGCLPMVVQIPVFIAFYKVLGSSIQLRHAPFMLWINDLAAPDRLSVGFDLPYVGGLPILTLLMGASMFIQQKMTPSTADPTQAKMMLLMPVVFTFLFINFPSGLVLYWLVNNLLSIGQQHWINKSKA